MALVPTPYDDKITHLKSRLGDDPHNPKKLRKKLDRTKAFQYGYQQQNAPPTPLPWDAQYETSVGAAGNSRDQALAGLTNQRLGIQQSYGIDQGYNDVASNPYSKAALLQASYRQNQNQTLNSYAARGQLYSGALEAGQSFNQNNYLHSNNDLALAYQAALQGVSDKELGANNDYEAALQAAEAKRLDDALSQAPDPSEAPPAPPYVKHLRSELKQKIKSQTRKGHDKKVAALRSRLQRI